MMHFLDGTVARGVGCTAHVNYRAIYMQVHVGAVPPTLSFVHVGLEMSYLCFVTVFQYDG